MDEPQLRQNLAGLPIPFISYERETDSTNERALVALGQEPPLPQFSLFIAERQSAGRGRMGRSWVTTPDASLAFTLVLHPTAAELAGLGLFSLLGALSICRALESLGASAAQVKWPNDVLLGGRKTAGVLAESRWDGGRLRGVVLGMGINLLPPSIPDDPHLLIPATCVQAHCAWPIKQLDVLHVVLAELIRLRPQLSDNAFLEMYARRLAFRGQQVQLTLPDDKLVTGELVGVDSGGQFILKCAGCAPVHFPIGDLRLRPVKN